MVRDDGAVQASKPSPVKIAPPARATRLGRVGREEARAAAAGSTTIARRRPIASAGQRWFGAGVPR